MRITQLMLNGFKLTKGAGISRLLADFTSPSQIIIGENGCGKTQVTRQLSPKPASRSLYAKEGSKSVVIDVGDHYYTIGTDYAKPSAPHYITKDDDPENLNQGGTTQAQEDLIAELVGITPILDDLMMNRITFPAWTPSKRKEFLMDHNPDDIGFVFQDAKLMASKIRACKANLTRLKSRKILLEQDLLIPEVVTDLQAEKQTIQADLRFFQHALMRIEMVGPSGIHDPADFDVHRIRQELRQIRYAMGPLRAVSRDADTRQQDTNRLLGQIGGYEQQLTSSTQDTQTHLHALHELEAQYRELAVDGDLLEIEATVTRLEHSAASLKTQDPDFILKKEVLQQYYQTWSTLVQDLQIFNDCALPLYTRKKRAHREQKLQQAQYRKSAYDLQIGDLKQQYQTLEKRHTITPRDIPDAPCAKNACPLYTHFMEGYEHTQAQRDGILRKIQRLEHKLKRLDVFLFGMRHYFHNSQPYHDAVQKLIESAQSNPILHQVLRGMDVLHVLQQAPQRIPQQVKQAYDHLDQWMRYKQVQSDLETAYALKARHNGSQSADTVKLVVSIESHKKALITLQDRSTTVQVQLTQTKQQLAAIQTYERLLARTLQLKQRYEDQLVGLADLQEHKQLEFLKAKFLQLQQMSFQRMGEVERILRDHETLTARYEEDFVKEIQVLEKELLDQEYIEKALVAIPRENMVDFINALFAQANKIIEIVWTSPFQIDLITDADPLNYTFQVSGDNDTSRELSEGSEGQTEILSLAINLALRIQLGHTNTPLVLDEVGSKMDYTHRRNLIDLLRLLHTDRIISQLFYISHDPGVHEGLVDTETMVLSSRNIVLPSTFNEHVIMS